ncbi:hypothetical protein Cabys_2271 [Caldithrix abyssi DSM 13497]|uniref:Uncharacterized protein n=1 Tax=Caldithrix abyssi DSM 13497 TaxID=880073 RepID=A0A1J1C9E0_CALAY|nr:hypothetical protein Cabys_2271 [Caldithrix abyssi DSM 13497]
MRRRPGATPRAVFSAGNWSALSERSVSPSERLFENVIFL